MGKRSQRSVILIDCRWGQPSCADLERLASTGERPRKDYVELARALDADVIDAHYMAERALPLAQSVARRVGLAAGQLVEAGLRQRTYRDVCAWSDQVGLPFALLMKLAGGRRDLVMIAQWTTRRKKAVFFTPLRVDTHIRAMVYTSSVQRDLAASRLGVAGDKLCLGLPPVDERFWRPAVGAAVDTISAVGWENRDYATLVAAMRGLDARIDLEVSSVGQPTPTDASAFIAARALEIAPDGLPPNVRLRQLPLKGLQHLYARSRFVVVPLKDVDYAAGSNALVEAMAMGKAVVVTRARGQVDYIRDGEHGIYVPPGDPAALRAAIEYLTSHPSEAERMGRAGRALVEQELGLDRYIARLVSIVRRREPAPAFRLAASGATPVRSPATAVALASRRAIQGLHGLARLSGRRGPRCAS